MKTQLKFRFRGYGGHYAQRDKIRYELHFSQWYEGKHTEYQYYVGRWDMENKDYISTEHVKRFKTSEEAEQFCQGMYEGTIDIAELKKEIEADAANRENIKNAAIMDGAEKVKALLIAKGIALHDFLEVSKLWSDTSTDSRAVLYKEAEEE